MVFESNEIEYLNVLFKWYYKFMLNCFVNIMNLIMLGLLILYRVIQIPCSSISGIYTWLRTVDITRTSIIVHIYHGTVYMQLKPILG